MRLVYSSPMRAGERLQKGLQNLIRERGTTAEQVAFAAEISKSYLSAVLRGKKSPTVRTLEKLAQALDVDVEQLFKHP
jgi:transcriptional regulator with XRE-family HTH domain